MKWRLSYGPEHPDFGNSQTQVIKNQNYEDEKDSDKMWAELLMHINWIGRVYNLNYPIN